VRRKRLDQFAGDLWRRAGAEFDEINAVSGRALAKNLLARRKPAYLRNGAQDLHSGRVQLPQEGNGFEARQGPILWKRPAS
jgi:hypothetical protein